ncbi:MAG: hypothetical protein ACTSPQ_01360 [Candidatus Helarchaeota archaeon]
MAYIEKSTNWIFNRMIFGGIKTLTEGINLVYSIIALAIIVFNTIVCYFTPFIGPEILQISLSIQFSIIISFIISSLVNFKLKNNAARIIISLGLIITLSILFVMYNNHVIGTLYNINFWLICISLVMVVISSVLLMRNSFNSWYYKIMVLGKSSKHFLFEKPVQFLSILSFSVFAYLIYLYIFTTDVLSLILAIIGISAGIFNCLAIFRTIEYEFSDIFKNIISSIYLISFIFVFLYYEISIITIIIDLGIFILAFLSIIQNIKYWDQEGGICSVKIDKKEKLPSKQEIQEQELEQEFFIDETDGSIVIVDETQVNKPTDKIVPSQDIEKSKKKDRSQFYLLILSLLLSLHLLYLWHFGTFLGLNIFDIYIFQNFYITNYFVCVGLFISVILLSILYYKSQKFRNFLIFPPTMRKAFLEFLSLIDKKERTKLLRAISRTVQQIIVEGLIEILESERGNILDTISEGIRRGAKFFRSIFGDKDE